MKIYSKFLITIFFTLSTFGGIAQRQERVQMLQTGFIDTRTGEITWSKAVDVDLVITLDGSDIYIDDQANTHIRTYGKSTEYKGRNDDGDYFTRHTWSAYDEKGRSCNFIMMYFKDKGLSVYAVMYNNVAFRYYIQKNLSNFGLWKWKTWILKK